MASSSLRYAHGVDIQREPGRFEVVAATRPVTDLKGLFGRPSKAVSIDDMNKAIAVRAAAKTPGMTLIQ